MTDAIATVGDYVDAVSHDGMRVSTNAMTKEELQGSQDAENPTEAQEPEGKTIKPIPKVDVAAEPDNQADADDQSDDDGADEPDGATPDKADAKADAKPRHSAKARMLEATRQAAELKRQLRERDAELQRLRSERARPTAPTPPATGDDEPDPTKYSESPEDVLRFVKDTAKWEAKQELRAAREAEARESEARQAAAREAETHEKLDVATTSFRERIRSVEDAEPGFKERVQHFTDLLYTTWQPDSSGRWAPIENVGPLNLLADEIVFRSDDPRSLIEYFVANPEEVQRIAALTSPRQFDREMAKVETRAAAAISSPAPSVPTTSRAKPPIRPVRQTPQGSDPDEVTGNESAAEYVRKMNAREDRERRRNMQV